MPLQTTQQTGWEIHACRVPGHPELGHTPVSADWIDGQYCHTYELAERRVSRLVVRKDYPPDVLIILPAPAREEGSHALED